MLNRLRSLQAQGKIEAAEASFNRILRNSPRHLHSWLGLGYCASLQGNRDSAMRAIEAALALGLTDEDSIIDCGNALIHLRELDSARALLARQPESVRVQLTLGALEERRGQHEAALAHYHAAHEIDPGADQPLLKMIDLYRRSGALDAAHAIADRLAALGGEQQAASWRLRAQLYNAAGDRPAAISALRTALERTSHRESYSLDLARELRQLRQFDEAHALLAAQRLSYGVLLALSELELLRRNHEMALHYAATARGLEPRKPDALARIVRIEIDRCDYAAAQAAADQIEACGEEHRVAALRCRLDIFKAVGDERNIVQILQELIRLQPADAGVRIELARQYRLTGDGEAAQRTLQDALALEADNISVLIEAAEQAAARDDPASALVHFRRVLALAPDSVWHYLRVARTLENLGEDEEAAQIYCTAEARFAKSIEILTHRIRIFRDRGLLRQALDEARQAHAAHPAHFGFWTELFELEMKLSPIERARQCLEWAVAQSRAEEIRLLAARARFAWRNRERNQSIPILEAALRLQPRNRHILGELFRLHIMTLDIDRAAACHAQIAILDAPGRLLRGKTTNASQSHDGQLLNDYLIDRRAIDDLAALKMIEPQDRVPRLLALIRRRPNHIPTAQMVLRTLDDGDLFNRSIAPASASAIPKRIGQFWDAPTPPSDLLELSRSWQEMNPDHHYTLFNEETARAYLSSHFPTAVVIAYRRCTDATTKADLFRLAFLTQEGGVWADMDDRCLSPLTDTDSTGDGRCLLAGTGRPYRQ